MLFLLFNYFEMFFKVDDCIDFNVELFRVIFKVVFLNFNLGVFDEKLWIVIDIFKILDEWVGCVKNGDVDKVRSIIC